MAFAIFFPSFAKHDYTVSARVFYMRWGQTPWSKNKWESDVSMEQPNTNCLPRWQQAPPYLNRGGKKPYRCLHLSLTHSHTCNLGESSYFCIPWWWGEGQAGGWGCHHSLGKDGWGGRAGWHPKTPGISGPVCFCFSYVTSGESLNILVPHFLISKMKIIIPSYLTWIWRWICWRLK